MLSKQCDAFARITNLSIITRRGDDHEGDGWSLLGHAARMTVRTCTVCPTSRTRLFGPWRYLANAVCPPTGVPLTAYVPSESLHACSAVLGRNRACISQGSLASLPRSPDFEPHRQKNELRSAAVRCAKRGRSGGRTRCCRRAGACHGPAGGHASRKKNRRRARH